METSGAASGSSGGRPQSSQSSQSAAASSRPKPMQSSTGTRSRSHHQQQHQQHSQHSQQQQQQPTIRDTSSPHRIRDPYTGKVWYRLDFDPTVVRVRRPLPGEEGVFVEEKHSIRRYSIPQLLQLQQSPLVQPPADMSKDWSRFHPMNVHSRIAVAVQARNQSQQSSTAAAAGDGARRTVNSAQRDTTGGGGGAAATGGTGGGRGPKEHQQQRPMRDDEKEPTPDWFDLEDTEDPLNPRETFDMERFKEEMRKREAGGAEGSDVPEQDHKPEASFFDFASPAVAAPSTATAASTVEFAFASAGADLLPVQKAGGRSRFGGRFFTLDEEAEEGSPKMAAKHAAPVISAQVPTTSGESDDAITRFLAAQPQPKPVKGGTEVTPNSKRSSNIHTNMPTSVLRKMGSRRESSSSSSDSPAKKTEPENPLVAAAPQRQQAPQSQAPQVQAQTQPLRNPISPQSGGAAPTGPAAAAGVALRPPVPDAGLPRPLPAAMPPMMGPNGLPFPPPLAFFVENGLPLPPPLMGPDGRPLPPPHLLPPGMLAKIFEEAGRPLPPNFPPLGPPPPHMMPLFPPGMLPPSQPSSQSGSPLPLPPGGVLPPQMYDPNMHFRPVSMPPPTSASSQGPSPNPMNGPVSQRASPMPPSGGPSPVPPPPSGGDLSQWFGAMAMMPSAQTESSANRPAPSSVVVPQGKILTLDQIEQRALSNRTGGPPRTRN